MMNDNHFMPEWAKKLVAAAVFAGLMAGCWVWMNARDENQARVRQQEMDLYQQQLDRKHRADDEKFLKDLEEKTRPKPPAGSSAAKP